MAGEPVQRIATTCPHCGKVLSIAATLAGTEVRCSGCHKRLNVMPGFADTAPPGPPKEQRKGVVAFLTRDIGTPAPYRELRVAANFLSFAASLVLVGSVGNIVGGAYLARSWSEETKLLGVWMLFGGFGSIPLGAALLVGSQVALAIRDIAIRVVHESGPGE